ncbi:MAG: Uma2 family endonuclease [Myxococcota bacterium]
MSSHKHADGFVMPGRSLAVEGGLQLRGPTGERSGDGGARSISLFERRSGSGSQPGDEQPGSQPEGRVEHRGSPSPVEEEAELMVPPPLLSVAALLTGASLSPDAQFRLEGSFTSDQLHALRERLVKEGRSGLRLELLNGDLYVTTTALARHVTAVVNLMVALVLILQRQEQGQVLTDFTNFLGDSDELVPDLLVLLAGDMPRLTEKGLIGPATIVVEVLSPSTAHLDRGFKLNLYLSAGAKEYWLVDPVKREVHIYTPEHLGLTWRAPHRIVRAPELLTTRYVAGLALPMEGVFERSYVHVDPVAAELARMLEAQVKQAQEAAKQAQTEATHAQAEAAHAQAEAAHAQAEAARVAAALEAEAVRAQHAQDEAKHAQAQAAHAQAEAAHAQAEAARVAAALEAEAARAKNAQEEAKQAQAQAAHAQAEAAQAQAEREAEAARAKNAQEEAKQAQAQVAHAQAEAARVAAELAAEATRAKQAQEAAQQAQAEAAQAQAEAAQAQSQLAQAQEAAQRAQADAARAAAERQAELERTLNIERQLSVLRAELERLRTSS